MSNIHCPSCHCQFESSSGQVSGGQKDKSNTESQGAVHSHLSEGPMAGMAGTAVSGELADAWFTKVLRCPNCGQLINKG